MMENLTITNLRVNQKIDIGIITLSEQDIIDYAKLNDPLDFHVNRKAAEASIFKGFVASGSQIFNCLYKTGWIKLFGHSVICGLELNHWKFIRPVYANQPIKGTVEPIQINENKEKGHVVITWKYEFHDMHGQMMQSLDVTIMHKL
jgi:acyl dehydratase